MSTRNVCLIIAIVLLVVAAWPPASARVTLGWLGVAFFAASFLAG